MHRKARVIAGATIMALAATITLIGFTIQPASADTQIGWVLDASGSAQCVVKSGTAGHVVCYHYPPGGGAASVVVDDDVPGFCLGGAYMISGDNAGNPAYIIYQNYPGGYCGRDYNYAGWFYGTSTCNIVSPAATWFLSNYYGQIQVGNFMPYNSIGGSWNQNCGTVGASKVGHAIYYV